MEYRHTYSTQPSQPSLRPHREKMAAGHVVYMSHGSVQLQLLSFTPPPAASESARALGSCACVHTCALLKWPPLPVPYEQKNALALQRSSFRENPTYFLTSVGSWVCELVFDAIYDWRSEFSHNRQTNTTTTVTLAAHARRGLMTDTHDNYRNPRCACAPRVNECMHVK